MTNLALDIQEKLNLTFTLCRDYDEKNRNVIGIQNEIVIKDGHAVLNFFIMVSGFIKADKNYRYDFIVECVDKNKDYFGKAHYLFTLNVLAEKEITEEGDADDGSLKSRFEGATSDISFITKNISFLGDGLYEIQAYCVEERDMEESWRERVKKRKDMVPQAVYPIRVRENINER